jgi:putative membrane protein
MPTDPFARLVFTTVVFTIVGLIFFAFAFWIIVKVSPFSIRKEIEDDQNTSLAIIIGAVIIGIALIVSAAVHG